MEKPRLFIATPYSYNQEGINPNVGDFEDQEEAVHTVRQEYPNLFVLLCGITIDLLF